MSKIDVAWDAEERELEIANTSTEVFSVQGLMVGPGCGVTLYPYLPDYVPPSFVAMGYIYHPVGMLIDRHVNPKHSGPCSRPIKFWEPKGAS